jgi:putative salt-induced outer membrane protein
MIVSQRTIARIVPAIPVPTRLLAMLLGLTIALHADEVRLTSGDALSGIVVKKEGDHLILKNKALGDVSIPWSAVVAISSEAPLVVVYKNGKSVIGRLSTMGKDLKVITTTATESVALADVLAIRTTSEEDRLKHPGVLHLWNGYGELGYAMARGNARTNILTTAFNASRTTRTDKTTAYFNQIYGSARTDGVVSTNANAIRGGWSYTRTLSSRLVATAINDYAYDLFQDLDLRAVIGAGLGYIVHKSENSRLDLLLGIDYDRENFGTGLKRNSAEAFVGDDWTYRVTGVTGLTQSFRVFPNLSNTGQYRINFDLGSVTTLKKWLAFHLTFSDRFLSNPLPGYQRNDLLLTTGFRVSFGQ